LSTPRRGSHAQEAPARAHRSSPKLFGTRREQKRLRYKAMAAHSKSLFARKAQPQYNHERAPCLLTAAAPQPSFSLAVSFQARNFIAPMAALR
jgi:hypothetical protein